MVSDEFVPFDRVFHLAREVFSEADLPPDLGDIHLVRNMYGRVYVAVSDRTDPAPDSRRTLERLAGVLAKRLGAHGNVGDTPVLFASPPLIETLRDSLREIRPGVLFAERMVTGAEWGTAPAARSPGAARRWTLYSVKGGVGRSTTAVVLSEHLARQGVSVLVVDLDLESPGIAPALVDEGARPECGVVDWFVEDLVEQGDFVLERMVGSPRWAEDCEGRALFAPAHGADPGDYLGKLGRVWMTRGGGWSDRLRKMVSELERRYHPEVVILESRSGMHDFAASAVTDLGARVLMFAVDSASHWNAYRVLFRYWNDSGLAPALRDRVQIVSAMIPELGKDAYVRGFRERSWHLFRDSLYDGLGGGPAELDDFSFGIDSDPAPHDPMLVHWNRGLAAGSSLGALDATSVRQAYDAFFRRFDEMSPGAPGGGP